MVNSGTLAAMLDCVTGPLVAGETPASAPDLRPPLAIVDTPQRASAPAASSSVAVEIDGAPGPEPTRYGDWERRGRCIDF
jgi:hypothetical protein